MFKRLKNFKKNLRENRERYIREEREEEILRKRQEQIRANMKFEVKVIFKNKHVEWFIVQGRDTMDSIMKSYQKAKDRCGFYTVTMTNRDDGCEQNIAMSEVISIGYKEIKEED